MLTKTEIAVAVGRTLFPMKVKSAKELGRTENVLKVPGKDNKLGRVVTQGRWKGFRIFGLSLEERATCPTSCSHWGNCYGNNMPFATRYEVDEALLPRMQEELARLQRKYPSGFAIRLHILGDFYSLAYVRFWREALELFPALHVWGYTGRIDNTDPVHHALAGLVRDQYDRFRIRWSGDLQSKQGALSYDDIGVPEMVTDKVAFLCPEQTGHTQSCGTCGACWQSAKPVVFTTH